MTALDTDHLTNDFAKAVRRAMLALNYGATKDEVIALFADYEREFAYFAYVAALIELRALEALDTVTET